MKEYNRDNYNTLKKLKPRERGLQIAHSFALTVLNLPQHSLQENLIR